MLTWARARDRDKLLHHDASANVTQAVDSTPPLRVFNFYGGTGRPGPPRKIRVITMMIAGLRVVGVGAGLGARRRLLRQRFSGPGCHLE